jgi:hypothetical protein
LSLRLPRDNDLPSVTWGSAAKLAAKVILERGRRGWVTAMKEAVSLYV